MKSNNGRADHLKNSLNYITDPQKTQNGILINGINCLPGFAYEEMMRTKERTGCIDGRQGYHIILSFVPGETDADTAHNITREFVEKFLKDDYELVYATHDDREHIHSHIVFNSVSWKTGKKYHYANGDWKKIMQPITNELTAKHGLSIMVNTRGNDTPYNMWQAEKDGKITWREVVRKDIDSLVNDAGTMGGLIIGLENIGYEVKYNPYSKSIAFKPYGAERFIRASSLGEGYSVKDINDKLYDGYTQEMGWMLKHRNVPIRRYKKKLKLSRLQAYYYRYMYMLGRIKRAKKVRVNPKDILHQERLQERVIFLHDNGINTINDLQDKEAEIKQKKDAQVTRRIAIYRAMKKYKSAFAMLGKYNLLENDEILYLSGDEWFKKNYEERQKIKNEIERISGMTIDKLVEKKRYYDDGLFEIREEIRKLNKEERICNAVREDYERERRERHEKHVKANEKNKNYKEAR